MICETCKKPIEKGAKKLETNAADFWSDKLGRVVELRRFAYHLDTCYSPDLVREHVARLRKAFPRVLGA